MSNVTPFRPRARKPLQVVVPVYTLMTVLSSEEVDAVDEHGCAAKLGLSVDELRRQQPVPPVEGIGGPYFALADVVRVMHERGIPILAAELDSPRGA